MTDCDKSTKLIVVVQPVERPEAVDDQLPGAIHFLAQLALAVGGPAAGSVQHALAATGDRADASVGPG